MGHTNAEAFTRASLTRRCPVGIGKASDSGRVAVSRATWLCYEAASGLTPCCLR